MRPGSAARGPASPNGSCRRRTVVPHPGARGSVVAVALPSCLPSLLAVLLTAAVPAMEDGQVELHPEDLPLERALAVDSTGWHPVRADRVVPTSGPMWLRTRVQVPVREPGAPLPALTLGVLGAWEAFWDGVPIGRNGQPGASPESELPGRVDVLLPLSLEGATPGAHVLTLRLSSHHLGFQPVGILHEARVGDAAVLARARLEALLPALCTLGALVLMGLHLLVRAASGPRRMTALLLGLACLAASALVLLESWRGVSSYAYPLQVVRLRLLLAALVAVALLLPAALAVAFDAPGRRWLFALLAGGLLAVAWVPGFDARGVVALALSLAVSLGLCVGAVRQRKPGARGVLACVLFATALLVMDPESFQGRGFFIAFGVLLSASVAHARQVRLWEARLSEALRATERLQLDLLSRSLQPHFLMNTLAALTETVETAPARAVHFIETLGEVYRHLVGMSGARTVALSRELELCRAYLALMSFRQGTRFELDVRGAPDLDATVPPALFHTLLENAFSHNRYVEPTTFRIEGERMPGRRGYRLVAPRGVGAGRAVMGEGTGTRYVAARLEEAFPGAWRLEAGPHEEGWTTRVEVPR
ncbi:histidine kinase [Corallococcus sp. bb12-1]|uniref:sensor histidine kinase n=1 Tax=Corallococcus sp. bb12-1 TaxID=2996784 RepID=UPI00226ED2E4|nr:histidine kinase [Corallococcus sp. bb12-1]MCY1041953.1 histidine kinase [Corallococcus sp. bb12-1]